MCNFFFFKYKKQSEKNLCKVIQTNIGMNEYEKRAIEIFNLGADLAISRKKTWTAMNWQKT